METISEYGHWGVAFLMIGIASVFLLGFIPLRKKNWRQLGMAEAFIVALYAEMYGFSLTVYFLSAILGRKIPFTHASGHLWAALFGWGEKGAFLEMIVGWAITFIGIGLIVAGWKRIYEAKPKDLVTNGIYAFIRHPQYTGIILATFGALIHWPTLLTFFLWPILIFAYFRLAKKEEKEMIKKYGTRYKKYQRKVPMFVPSLSSILRFLKKKKFLVAEGGE